MKQPYVMGLTLLTMLICATLTITAAPTVRLPTQLVTMNAQYGDASWFETTLSDVPAGFDITNGTYHGWCVQKNIQMTQDVSHTVLLYSSYDSQMPESFRCENWDKINYVLNHKQGERQSVQDVLWYYINLSQFPSDPDAQAMVADADAQGTGYVPKQGNLMAILIEGVPVIQRTFLEVTLPPKLTLGDFVWNDIDADGIQDAGEPGISGVTVSLYTENGTLIDSTITDRHGVYSFAYFPLGKYYIEFSVPIGYRFSPKDQGTDEAKDSDADSVTGRTDIAVFNPEQYDTSWDAGMYQPSTSGYAVSSNHAPTADGTAGEPYQAFVNDTITFDGSRSYDRDGWIISWDWTFGDGSNGTGESINHSYDRPGRYPVNLKVTDNEFATDNYSTTAVIRLGNNPPVTPVISGVSFGHTNISYVFLVRSTDPDKNLLKYVFDWGDGSQSRSPLFMSGHGIYTMHRWSAAGFYTVQVYAQDFSNATSAVSGMMVSIDVLYVQNLGYLINNDGFETFDLFYSNQTGKYTHVQREQTGEYSIDTNGDGRFDYQFNVKSGMLTTYHEKLEFEYTMVIVVIGFIIILFLLVSVFGPWKNDIVLKHSGGRDVNQVEPGEK
ncbi:MAG: PKD domain-containing protein [Thermoplasmata archaeon]|nr:PKD domain-containing protein [Thermoplasmata archaeon]